ncbi:hypothetical protein CR513_06322, partial [Mucuna pruriens]
MMGSMRVVRRVLLVKREPLFLLPTNKYLQFSAQFPNLLAIFRKMPKSFQKIIPKYISRGLLAFKGIKHHIDFTLGAILPNREAYRANPEVSKEIQQQVGKIKYKDWVWDSKSPCVVPVILVSKKEGHHIPHLDNLLDELHGACIFL